MESFSDVLRSVVASCQTPVIVLLLLAAAFSVICIGSLVAEFFTEHRRFRVYLPKLIDDLKASPTRADKTIKESGLLLRQKRYLIELTRHPNITPEMRESLAVGLEHQEARLYDGRVKITDTLARLAPMLGLLGTLIPLGPGIVALGQGDAEILSSAMLTAFDTTSLGLMVAAVALIVSAVRKRWYKTYMVNFDAVMECVLETEKEVRGTTEEVWDA